MKTILLLDKTTRTKPDFGPRREVNQLAVDTRVEQSLVQKNHRETPQPEQLFYPNIWA